MMPKIANQFLGDIFWLIKLSLLLPVLLPFFFVMVEKLQLVLWNHYAKIN